MRILVLPLEFPSQQRPMAGIFILRRVQALAQLGHEIAVLRIVPYAPPIGEKWRSYRSVPDTYDVEGISVRTLRAIIPPRRLGMEFIPWQVGRGLRAEIERFKPDVLHASFLIPCGQVAVRQRLVPTVVTAHGGDAYRWPFERPGLKRAAREAILKANRVTAVSAFIARCVQSIAQREVDVIWNGGDEHYFFPRDRTEARTQMVLPRDRFVVAFAGNILRAKGIFDLVDAAAGMQGHSPLLLIAGSGPQEPALRDFAQQRGVEVRMLGLLSQDRVATMYAAADAVALPSYNEGLPNVVCEAMLSGRAVVASTVGGIPEIIEDRRTGLLVGPGEVGSLRNALATLADDVNARDDIARAAHTFAQANLTWRVSASRYADVLASAANVARS